MAELMKIAKYRSFAIFVLGGVLNTTFSYTIYLIASDFLSYRIAYFLSYLAGILFSYFFNCIFVFKKNVGLKSFFAFPLVYLTQYFIGAILLDGLILGLGITSKYAPLVITALMLPITFLMSKLVLNKTAKNR